MYVRYSKGETFIRLILGDKRCSSFFLPDSDGPIIHRGTGSIFIEQTCIYDAFFIIGFSKKNTRSLLQVKIIALMRSYVMHLLSLGLMVISCLQHPYVFCSFFKAIFYLFRQQVLMCCGLIFYIFLPLISVAMRGVLSCSYKSGAALS